MIKKKSEQQSIKELTHIARESKKSLIALSDFFFPHHKRDSQGNTIPPASIHQEFSDLLIGTVGNKTLAHSYYNLLAILPRGCAKSTYANVFFVIWLLLFSNKLYIVLVGATEESIKVHFETLKYEITNNKLLHAFGIKPLKGGSSNKTVFDIEAVNVPGFEYLTGNREVRLHAVSPSSMPRGLKKGATRPDMFIIDDLEVKKSGNKPGVENKKYREEIRDCFDAKIYPSRFNDESMQIVMLGTIMNESMLLYSLYKDALMGESTPHFKTIKYSMIQNHGTPEAKSIWPEKMTVENFDRLLKTATRNGTQNVVYNEYLSETTAPDDKIFFKKDFRYFNFYAGVIEPCDVEGNRLEIFPHIRLKDTRVVITSDLAYTVNQRSDFTALAIVAIDKEDNKYVLDIVYGKWLLEETVEKFKMAIKQYNPVAVGVEEAGGGKYLIQMLEKELADTKNFNYITPLKPGGLKKNDRIINKLQFPYRQGSIFHLHGGHYVDDLEYQVLSVTKDDIKSPHDDMVDALSYIYDISDTGAIYANNDYESHQYDYIKPNCSYIIN